MIWRSLALAASLGFLCLALSGASAQDAAAPAFKPAAPSINYRERPRYPFDPQRLKRRPTLDGRIGDNEWDPLYTIGDTAARGTVYLNWDDDNLYFAAKLDQPSWIVLDLDCSADGWLRGADNLELTFSPPTADGSTAVSARILDAAGNKDAPVWNDRVVDTRLIQVVQKVSGAGCVLEAAIPKGVAGLALRSGATLSCRADLLPASSQPTPTAPYEPHLLVDINLVEARTVAVAGLTPRISLEDSKLIPGQQLRASLDLVNQAESDARIRAVSWAGNTNAQDLLRAERDPNVPPVKGLKSLRVHYNSAIPETAIPGFYQLTATAELDNGQTVQATTSFAIVEPFTLQVSTSPDPINVLGPTQAKIFVEIGSAVPGYARGDVEIEPPAGWEVKGRRRKDFYIGREDSSSREQFFVVLPSNTPAGDYLVHATVYWRNRSWKSHTTAKVNRPAPPEAAPKPDAEKKP